MSPTLLNDYMAYRDEVMYGERYACTETDLINKLNRVPFIQTEPMLKGIAFEKCLTADGCYTMDGFTFNPSIVDRMRNEVRGGMYQYFLQYELETSGYVAVFNCYLDFFKENRIIDVKTAGQYHFPNYINSFQHKIYLLGMNAKGNSFDRFDYLVTDFYDVYRETYTLNTESYRADLLEMTNEMIFFIEHRRHLITNPKAFDV